MAIAYEPSLSKEFLKMVLNYIKGKLQSLLDSSSDVRREVMPPLHHEILRPIFPHEMGKIEDAAREVVREVDTEVSEYKRRVINALLKMLDEVQRRREEEAFAAPQAYGESTVQPFYRTLEVMTRMHVEITDVFSSRSFMAAFLVVSALYRKLLQLDMEVPVVKVRVKREEAYKIHSTWSRLAEKGECLICRPEYARLEAEEMCKILEVMGKSLSEGEKLNKVHDSMADYLRSGKTSRLSRITYNALSPVVQSEEVKRLLSNYITDHLCTLGEQLNRAQQPIGIIEIEDIQTYINEVFVKRGFLEYEVYSALVRQGIAAIPRIHFPIPDVSRRMYEFHEVDVVATAGDELWLVEVTTSTDEKDLEDKANRYANLKYYIGADKVLFVGSSATCELSNDVFESHLLEGFFCVRFDELYSGILKLLTTKAKR